MYSCQQCPFVKGQIKYSNSKFVMNLCASTTKLSQNYYAVTGGFVVNNKQVQSLGDTVLLQNYTANKEIKVVHYQSSKMKQHRYNHGSVFLVQD